MVAPATGRVAADIAFDAPAVLTIIAADPTEVAERPHPDAIPAPTAALSIVGITLYNTPGDNPATRNAMNPDSIVPIAAT